MNILAELDRSPDVGVSSRMARRAVSAPLLIALGIALVFGATACGGKDKKEPAKPSSSGTVTTEDTELMEGEGDPVAPWEAGSQSADSASPGTPGADDADAAGSPDTPDASAGNTDQPSAPPPIEPPDLDLSAGAQKKRVAGHLRAAWKALEGPNKNPDAAIREARAALAVDATNIDAVVVIAHAYYVKRLYDTAEVVLDMTFKERKKAKTNPGIYYVYGLIYDRTDRPERAVLAYQKAVDLAPTYRSALVNLGAHQIRNRSYAEAIVTFERLTGELDVATAVTWNNLGSAYRGRSGDYPVESARRNELVRKAETSYKRALNVDGKYGKAYYNLGLLYLDADPFPGPDGQPLDLLKRLERAKTYFDEYRTMSGADIDLVNSRTKQVEKLIKREKKRRKRSKDKKSGSGDDW